MTRRDTIIIATLVNAGLLACLFVTATRQEEVNVRESYSTQIADAFEVVEVQKDLQNDSSHFIADEVDQALKEFVPDEDEYVLDEPVKEVIVEKPVPVSLVKETPKEQPLPKVLTPQVVVNPLLKPTEKCVDVTVKKGDMLEKIARANGTTVKAIKDASGLTSDKLRVGQVLKVPVGSKPVEEKPKNQPVAFSAEGPTYYTVQSGDNPWKIAKKFHVKFEDILHLNNMTEEKAKNLKVGQEIRVK